MNTITINTEVDGQVSTVTYTETEVLHFRKKVEEANDTWERYERSLKEIRDLRNQVRDFFSEGEWQDGETTCNKGDVNAMLERIGANKITSTYTGTFNITGTFSIEVEDEDEVEDIIVNNTEISNWSADMNVDDIEIHDVEEDN